MALFPVFLELKGRPVLVVGGGPAAARKVRSLLETGALVRLVAPRLCEELERLAVEGRLGWRRRVYRRRDARGCMLVFAATDSHETNARIGRDARRRGLFHTVMSRGQEGDMIVAAAVRRDPIVVAVSSSGKVPYLTKKLRERLERMLPLDLGEQVERLAELRERVLVDAPADSTRRAEAVDQVLESGVEDVLRRMEKPWSD